MENSKHLNIKKVLRHAEEDIKAYDFNSAENRYNRVLEYDPNNESALEGLIILEEQKTNFCKDAIDLAYKEEYHGNYEQSIAILNALLNLEPNNKRAQKRLFLVKEIAIKNTDINKLLLEAADLLRSNEFGKAEQLYKKVLTIKPNDYSASIGLRNVNDQREIYNNELLKKASIEASKENYTSAISILKEILKTDPHNKKAKKKIISYQKNELHEWADIHLDSHDFDDAIEDYNQILEIDPEDEIALCGLKKVEKKKKIFKTNAITIGKLQEKKGQDYEAKDTYEHLLKLEPHNKEAKREIRKLKEKREFIDNNLLAAKNQLMADNYDAAITTYKSVLSKDPHNIEAERGISDVMDHKCESLRLKNDAFILIFGIIAFLVIFYIIITAIVHI